MHRSCFKFRFYVINKLKNCIFFLLNKGGLPCLTIFANRSWITTRVKGQICDALFSNRGSLPLVDENMYQPEATPLKWTALWRTGSVGPLQAGPLSNAPFIIWFKPNKLQVNCLAKSELTCCPPYFLPYIHDEWDVKLKTRFRILW